MCDKHHTSNKIARVLDNPDRLMAFVVVFGLMALASISLIILAHG